MLAVRGLDRRNRGDGRESMRASPSERGAGTRVCGTDGGPREDSVGRGTEHPVRRPVRCPLWPSAARSPRR